MISIEVRLIYKWALKLGGRIDYIYELAEKGDFLLFPFDQKVLKLLNNDYNRRKRT